MKQERNESDQRFYDLQIEAGYAKPSIQEPDSDDSVIGTADFLVGDCVFELKEVVPNHDAKSRYQAGECRSKNRRYD